jgi:hypothetical protein
VKEQKIFRRREETKKFPPGRSFVLTEIAFPPIMLLEIGFQFRPDFENAFIPELITPKEFYQGHADEQQRGRASPPLGARRPED